MKAIHTQNSVLPDHFTITCAFEVTNIYCICRVKMIDNGRYHTPLPNSTFGNILLEARYEPGWEHLYHGNWKTL